MTTTIALAPPGTSRIVWHPVALAVVCYPSIRLGADLHARRA